MSDRIAVRSISDAVMKGLEALALRHDRSLEGEARFALRSWVEPLMQQAEQSTRRTEVSARLRELLQSVNGTSYRPFLKPSHIAEEIGEDHAEEVEKWFIGKTEPSFRQLDKVAEFLGGVPVWLRHGDRQPFSVEQQRIPEDLTKAIEWLLDVEGDTQKVDSLHLVRSEGEAGSFAVVKRYGKWRCKTFLTPYHISEVIGAGGESSLAVLSVILRLLYKYYVRKGKPDLIIQSHIFNENAFNQLAVGRVHPVTLLDSSGKVPWWEDFWDASMFRDERKGQYWVGWRSVCERIYDVVEQRRDLRDLRDLIIQEVHPLLSR